MVAASLATRRRRGLGLTVLSGGSGADPFGGSGIGADPLGMSTLAPLVMVCAVTFARSRKVARNVLR